MYSQDSYLKVIKYISKIYSRDIEHLTHSIAISSEVIHACIESKLDDDKTDFSITLSCLIDIFSKSDLTYDDIFNEFGFEIAEALESLSINKSLGKKEQFQDNINQILTLNYEIQMIRLADTIIKLEEQIISLSEAKLILSCLKNSNLYLSKRLEEKINNFKQ